MKNIGGKKISVKVTTILIIFILLFSATIVSLNFNILAQNDANDDNNEIASHDGSSRQPPIPEKEPNDHPIADDINIEEIDNHLNIGVNNVNLSGGVAGPFDTCDWYKITLYADFTLGDAEANNLSLFITDLSCAQPNTYVFVKIYGIFDTNGTDTIQFDEEFILLSIEKYYTDDSANWNVTTFGLAYTTPYDWYYICIEGHSFGDNEITYLVGVRVRADDDPSLTEDIDDDLVLQPDSDRANANNLIFTLPGTRRTVDMDADAFDWYVINTPTTDESIGTNFSIKISVDESFPNEKVGGIYYLTELIVLIQYEYINETGVFIKENAAILRGSKNDLLFQDTTPYLSPNIQFSEISQATTIYVGIYVTTYGVLSAESAHNKYYDDNGHTHGWAQYIIKSHFGKTIIPPKIDNIGVTSLRTGNRYGRTYDVFKYQLTYTDRNNDLPTIMKVTIDDTVTYDLLRSNPDDPNLRDGTDFEFLIDGTFLYDINGNDHNFTLHVRDSETYANGSYENGGVIYPGPNILNNVPPYPRPTAPTRIYLYEDSPPKYLNLNKIFEDIDPGDELVFKILNENGTNWSNSYENDDMIINILDNDNLKIITKPNQHGNAIVELNASDMNHVVDSKAKLEVTIISVNDPPQIKTPFSKLYFLGELHVQEDGENETFNMNDIFWDPIENDPLKFTFTGNEEIKINIDDSDTATISPGTDWSGTEKVTFTASDGQASGSDALIIIIDTKNDPPILNQTPMKRVYENQWCNFTISAYDPDPGDKLTYATDLPIVITSLDQNKFSFDKHTGRVAFQPDYRSIAPMPYLVTISATDSHGAITSGNVEIEILNIEDPPIPIIIKPTEYTFIPEYEITFVGDAEDPDLKIPGTTGQLFFWWRSNIDGLLGEGKVLERIKLSQGLHTITLEVVDNRFSRKATITIKIAEHIDLDSDNDGIPDWWEERYSVVLDPRDPRDAGEDPDKDGLTNLDEYKIDSDPNDPKDPGLNYTPPEKDSGLDQMLILSIVIILIIIFIVGVAVMIYYRNVKNAAEEVATALKAKEQAEEDAAERRSARDESRGWGKYRPKFNEKEVLCYDCGKSLDVNSVVRPLAITCNVCGSKSVVYDR